LARDASKNTSNYLSLGTNALGPLLNGAAKISMHALVVADTFDTGTNDNRILSVYINGTTTAGVVLALAGSAGAEKVRVGGRSQSLDSFQAVSGATTVSAGTVYGVGGVLDLSGDSIRVYLDGAQDASSAATFANASYTNGTPTAADSISGAVGSGSSTFFDGRIAEVAIWAGDIGAAGFGVLAQRVSPMLVRPDLLVSYWPLIGRESPERDRFGGVGATITGTVATADHPRVVYSTGLYVGLGAAASLPYDPGAQTSLGSFNQVIFRRRWA
jgi:hypothetical protein